MTRSLCPGVAGPAQENLAAVALRAFREATGWDGAASAPERSASGSRSPRGSAGGSADAACGPAPGPACLRARRRAAAAGDRRRAGRGRSGAGVARAVAGDGGGRAAPAAAGPPPPLRGAGGCPAPPELSTGAVYAEADRLGLERPLQELAERAAELAGALAHGAAVPAATELLHNDLQRAAVSLCPEIGRPSREVAGRERSWCSSAGRGPPSWGSTPRPPGTPGDGPARAELAVLALRERTPAPLWAVPVDETYAQPLPLDAA